jgi:hypothetical protein
MRILLATVMLTCLSAETAHALQNCPAGNLRIAPDSRYSDNGDSTVTDNLTRLMWKQCSEGQAGAGCAGTATLMDWQVALTAGSNSSFAGYNDWRLPNVKELNSLVETACYNPAINELRFPNTPVTGVAYWTSSVIPNTGNAWGVNFGVGVISPSAEPIFDLRVRLVRGEQ